MPDIDRGPNTSLHYELDDFTDPWADRPTVLLQHGNGRSGAFWYRWVPYLSRYYKVVRPDMRGLGASRMPADRLQALSLEELVADVLAVLEDLGVSSVHYCGESMGGIVGLAMAAWHPERVRSLTLVATPVFIEAQMKNRYALGHASRVDAMRAMGIREWVSATTAKTRLPAEAEPDLFAWYVEQFSAGDPDVQVAMSTLVNEANALAFLPQVRAPTLGLYPTAGQITSAEQESILREGLRDFTQIHLPTPYHMVQLLHPRACTKAVLAFLERLDGPLPADE